MSAERRGPAICNVSNIGEGKDEMTKASIDLQDLRRRIYVKAKAEPSWRFWGLYEPIPPNTLAELRRDMARRRLVSDQIRQIEDARLERLKQTPSDGPHVLPAARN